MTCCKVWLYLCFYPQEGVNRTQLKQMRQNLSPFLKSIIKALNFELVDVYRSESVKEYKDRQNSICEEIIQALRSGSSLSNHIRSSTSRSLNTLQLEHDRLGLNFE